VGLDAVKVGKEKNVRDYLTLFLGKAELFKAVVAELFKLCIRISDVV
jgi:hypothetical protein